MSRFNLPKHGAMPASKDVDFWKRRVAWPKRELNGWKGVHFFPRLRSALPLLAQPDRAPGFEPGGWGFESLGAGHFGRHLQFSYVIRLAN